MSSHDSGADESGHHLPAVEDWPKGYGEASWWPIVTAAGAVGMYLGAGLFVLAFGEEPLFLPIFGPFVFVLGVGLFLIGLYGWTYHAFVSHYWSRAASGDGKYRWGMVLFLTTDLGTFGAIFSYYFWVRLLEWPPVELPQLLSSLVLINTGLLVISSLTMHVAHLRLRGGNRRRYLIWLGATQILGTLFLGGQLLEYYEFVVAEGFTLASGFYFSAFYGLTGLHGLHVVLGLILIGIVLLRSVAGQYSPDRDVSVTTVAMYWHFVDAVWILLVAAIYAGAAVT
ncbi:heme-copper oxidase subunit III [Halorientalis brevis]|uniref:Heme-copper oxidase subunit III n=1 Tax=Halorientalis brevis TaxID=1126241 RepID=A0ABD6CF02_9EURY|nr:heme-copper oxidase subunit III [Halorientalis brevis]